MELRERRRTWDSSHFRREHMTSWPRNHPVMFPHVQTDHWSKMKTMVPGYLASIPSALLKDRGLCIQTGCGSDEGVENQTTSSQLPPLTAPSPSAVQQHNVHHNTPKTSPQNMAQYRNMFNERARRGFCYWVMEKRKSSTCRGYSFGAYKTSLGLPKV